MRGHGIRIAVTAALLAATVAVASVGAPVRAEAGEGRAGAARAMNMRIATGFGHTCVVLDTGQVNCWGRGAFGQLGSGSDQSIGTGAVEMHPVSLPLGREAVAIAAGNNHTCALLADAKVTCWGLGLHGQLGYGNTANIGDNELVPDNPVNGGIIRLPRDAAVSVIAAGGNHTCVIAVPDYVYCWGDNSYGQLGYGNTNAVGDNEGLQNIPAVGITVDDPVALALGARHTCVLGATGNVTCWGEGTYGQLGFGNTSTIGDDESPGGVVPLGTFGPTMVPYRATAITAGDAHTCVILNNAQVKCWGAAGFGQLGRGNTTNIGDNETPASIGVLNIGNTDAIESISAGDSHTCAATFDHVTYCWGNGEFGRTGRGTTVSIGDTAGERPDVAVQLPDGLGARAVSAGAAHTCALLDGNAVVCWGQAIFGQLGYGNTNVIGDDEQVSANTVHGGRVQLEGSAGSDGVALAVGHGAHTCAIVRGGAINCWGANAFGQLGLGHVNAIGDNEFPDRAWPVVVPGNRAALSLVIGEFHTCALLAGGVVSCWGSGSLGRLGYGNTATIGDNETPAAAGLVQMPGNEPAIALAAGVSHTCALLASGRVSCWGANAVGQLGYGNTTAIGDNERPSDNTVNGGYVPMTSFSRVKAIAAGGNTTCAILVSDSVACWGENSSGQLGYGTTANVGDNETLAAPGPGLGGFVFLGNGVRVLQVSVGREHVCVVRTDLALLCWGANSFGQLGNGTGTSARIGDDEQVPQGVFGGVVPTGVAVRSVSAGWSHTCVVTTTYTVRCWGQGSAGRLGYGNTVTIGDDETAAAAGDLSNITSVGQVAANNSHTCDVHSQGLIYCWGYGGDGRLGWANQSNIGDVVQPGSIELLGVHTAHSSAPTEYRASTLTRLLDTRAGQPYDGGAGDGIKLQPTVVRSVMVVGRGGVAPGATSASLNFTVTGATATGFLRAYPCLAPSLASTLNFTAGQTVANHTIIGLGSSPNVCIEVSSPVHVIVDVGGAFGQSAHVQAVSPARLLDTRPGSDTIDGVSEGGGAVLSGNFLTLQVTGRGGVPADATAVWLNVVAVNPTGNGFVTTYPCANRPLASSLNFVTGVNRANGVLVPVDPTGKVCLFTSTTTHLLADVTAYLDRAAPLLVTAPQRLVDTRSGQSTIDGIANGAGRWAAGVNQEYSLLSRAGIGPGARAVVLNITGVSSTNGYITVARCFSSTGGSTINIGPGTTVANTVIVELFPGDRICGTSSVAAHVIIDLEGIIH